MPQLSKCPLSAWVPKFPSRTQVSHALAPKCFWSSQMPLKCSRSAQVPLECPTSPLWMLFQKKRSATLLEMDSLKVLQIFLKKSSKYLLYITLIVFYFLRNKMCNFSHVLLNWYNHSKGLKPALNILWRFRKLKWWTPEFSSL